MLDLEIHTAPAHDGLNVVPLLEMKQHLRIPESNTKQDEDIKSSVRAAADMLHGVDGVLNRTIFPMTWVRYLPAFPCDRRVIQLPYPPLRRVVSIEYEDRNGSSPLPGLASDDFVVRKGPLVAEIEIKGEASLRPSVLWPQTATNNPRCVAITYEAGYETYPEALKRLVKFLAAHFLENKEATINETRMLLVSRKTEFGGAYLISQLRVPVAQDDWD